MVVVASRPVIRGLGAAIAVVLLVGTLAALASRDDGVPEAGARVTVDGRATVVHLDGSSEVLASGDVVRAGEEVRADAGTFTLELADGGMLEGRAGFGRARDTRVVVGERPELVSGELLVVGDDGLAVDAAGTIVSLAADDAAARVDRGLAVRAASYEGALAVDSAGQARSVPALRQLGIASLGRPPGSAEPIRVVEADPWDRRFLGGAIALGRQLDAQSSSFTGNAPVDTAGRAALLARALPGLADDVSLEAAAAGAPPGELLVGGVLALLGRGGAVADRWEEVLDFRGDGAGWGLVALDQRVGEEEALRGVADALGRVRGTTEVASPPGPGVTGTPGDPGPTPGPTAPPGSTAPPGPTPGGPPPTEPTPTAPPPTLPPPTTPPPTVPILPPPPPDDGEEPSTGVDLLDGVADAAENLLGGLLGQ